MYYKKKQIDKRVSTDNSLHLSKLSHLLLLTLLLSLLPVIPTATSLHFSHFLESLQPSKCEELDKNEEMLPKICINQTKKYQLPSGDYDHMSSSGLQIQQPICIACCKDHKKTPSVSLSPQSEFSAHVLLIPEFS